MSTSSSPFVNLRQEAGVTFAAFSHPPANAIHTKVAEAIADAIELAALDENCRAIVLHGEGKWFAAGADIRELQEVMAGAQPAIGLTPAYARIESCPKPVIAAIHGLALGGGLELAMAAHYRVALETAAVGQPEVNLGLMPGAGGTQRLPRLVGVEHALSMLVSGDQVTASMALDWGLLDVIVEDDLLKTAADYATLPPRPTALRGEKLAAARAESFVAARERAASLYPGKQAALWSIEAVEAATQLGFEEGIARETELFAAALRSEEAREGVRRFFAAREKRQ